jgi:coproporphyrinogen III oxidase-like Fe-S oxidoreductase
MLGLRTRRGIDWRDVELQMDMNIVSRLEKAGFLEVSHGRLRLTPQGMLVSNEVLAEILP